ncbi:MAG: 3-phosphoshikimate 1-carboxyvinyltransferase [Rickettsiales bacterium]|nr:3-phosphoshikimate 1-carboxyvinyltransferase [Rickettsiales bacterium]
MPSLRSYKKDIPLKGEVQVAGDKSISHRSLIFAALAHGETKITGLLEGEDVLKTAAALRSMQVDIKKENDGTWIVNGSGVAGLCEPSDVLDMGNSGTAARLIAGLVCPYNFTSFFTGDSSLRKRPMGRVFEPITAIGAKIMARQNNLMPFAIIGAENPMPISYTMKVASAQVKSCVLLAALSINGITEVIEPEKCRNHSEIMMDYLGIKISRKDFELNGKSATKISYQGLQEFDAKDFTVPGDISSAAFLIVAALLVKDSKIIIKNVGVNPLRDGVVTTLIEMGGKIELTNQRLVGGEKVADIIVESSKLKGIEVPAERAPIMIDEYPILAVAAANASGTTKMNGLAELKVKESNRLLMIAQNLEKCGVTLKMGDDSLEVQGISSQPKELVKIKTAMDHRIAMSFLIMGLTLENGVEIDDDSMINTSFPNFTKIFADFGCSFI